MSSISIKKSTAALITIILMGSFNLFVPPIHAQTITLTNLPSDTINTRFFSDEYPIHHPSLSLNGFDCDRRNCDEGLGLKQILEEVYNIQTFEVQRVYDVLVNESIKPIDPPASHNDVWNNTVRLQARGFVALASYILERNGNDPTALTPALPPSSQAIADFLAPLVDASLWMIDGGKETDGVKWATPTTNVARAMDFYLALENAYAHFDSVEYNNQYATVILSKSEKDDLLTDYTLLIDAAEQYGGEYNGYVGVDGYDYQAGNWPLKVQLAIGYAILTWQNSNNDDCSFNYFCDFNGWLERAFKAAGQHSGNNRYNYWRYQVDDGKDFWAEGPYYHHLTLSQVIPFWHAARINDLLSNTAITGYTISGDPFFEDWFVRPLSWLADLATPDGKTPPLDDGNKQVMYNASLLRWTGAYGDGSVGQKFAWISNIASRPSMLPVEIAIPRQSTPTSNLFRK